MLALTGCTIGGSFYMLNFSLTPNAKILSKDADSYPFMYRNYPFLRPWVDSLKQVDALKDTFIINPHGIQLHAYYVAAPQPTSKTAVIVHGHTDNAIRMFMIGYLYNRDLGYNILLPDLQHQGESEGPAIQMGWKDRWDVLQWMNIANEIFGDSTQMVVHGISMGGATTMMVSGEEQKPFVKCFVEDCGYTSVWDEFSHELKASFHLPPFPLMYTTSWLCEKKYGWNFKEASSLRCCLFTGIKTRMCLPGWYIRSTKPNRDPKNYGLFQERLMQFHTKRINRNTPTESVHSSGDTFIKPIITRSFRFITEKVSIFANVK